MPIPTDAKKIRERIRRYERKWKSPDFDDGAGTRFLTGPLYLLLGDIAGAIAHYSWYSKKFEEYSFEPFHALSWALATHRDEQPEEALYRLRCAHCANVYIIPTLLGVPHGQTGAHRGSNWQEEGYISRGPQEFLSMWQPDEKKWLRSVWDSPAFKEFVAAHAKLKTMLSDEPRGPRRMVLAEALHAMTSRDWDKSKVVAVATLH